MVYAKWLSGHDDLSEAIRIRYAVFVDEQGFPADDEPDEMDEHALHVLAGEDDEWAATGRLFQRHDDYVIGRLAVLSSHRKRGLGDLVMRMLIDKAFQLGAERIILSSQMHAIPFYARFGFEPQGDTHDDCGEPHQTMVLNRKGFLDARPCNHSNHD